ncbi:MAG: DUF72 domain-containing protein [Chloroflexi bacterium]|nr:DUF72 domain-containing protein [Chloroflexota bacterium]
MMQSQAIADEGRRMNPSGFVLHPSSLILHPSMIFLGTQGWSYKSWEGVFYPQGTPSNRYLADYATKFKAIEIDSSFYSTPRLSNIEKWDNDTPADFRFAAKFPKQITHEKMLDDVARETAFFLDTLSKFGAKLGPLCLQFAYEFSPDKRDLLDEYLASLPSRSPTDEPLRYAVEVRHRGWFKDWFFELLKKHRAALVLVDRVTMPKLDIATTDFTYIRWLGNRKDVPDDAYTHVRIHRDKELDEWADTIAELHERDVDVWAFANNHYMGHSPATLREIQARLKERGVIE